MGTGHERLKTVSGGTMSNVSEERNKLKKKKRWNNSRQYGHQTKAASKQNEKEGVEKGNNSTRIREIHVTKEKYQ